MHGIKSKEFDFKKILVKHNPDMVKLVDFTEEQMVTFARENVTLKKQSESSSEIDHI